MKKQFYILTVIFTTLIFPFLAQAQMTYEDVVYLKNGSIIHGTIIEQVPNQSIKIQTKDGNVFVYKIDEVQKMTKEEAKHPNSSNMNYTRTDRKQSGFTNITEMNFGLGTGTASDDYSIGIQTINGYQFNPNFNLGFGVGVDQYKNATFLPIFADFRINFLATSVTPFFDASAGYSLGFSGNKGGLLLNPSFGVKIFVSPKTALNFSIGYRYQENSIDFVDYGYYNFYSMTIKEKESLINIKFGVTF